MSAEIYTQYKLRPSRYWRSCSPAFCSSSDRRCSCGYLTCVPTADIELSYVSNWVMRALLRDLLPAFLLGSLTSAAVRMPGQLHFTQVSISFFFWKTFLRRIPKWCGFSPVEKNVMLISLKCRLNKRGTKQKYQSPHYYWSVLLVVSEAYCTAKCYGWPNKFGTIILYTLTLPSIYRFSKLFHYHIRRKFVIILSLKIPPHLKCVATIPCEMSSVLKATIENKSSQVKFNKFNNQLCGQSGRIAMWKWNKHISKNTVQIQL